MLKFEENIKTAVKTQFVFYDLPRNNYTTNRYTS